MSGGFVKEERLFRLVRGENEARQGSFADQEGTLRIPAYSFVIFW